jgi:hypothetical protein
MMTPSSAALRGKTFDYPRFFHLLPRAGVMRIIVRRRAGSPTRHAMMRRSGCFSGGRAPRFVSDGRPLAPCSGTDTAARVHRRFENHDIESLGDFLKS